jgi:hypothetical protein
VRRHLPLRRRAPLRPIYFFVDCCVAAAAAAFVANGPSRASHPVGCRVASRHAETPPVHRFRRTRTSCHVQTFLMHGTILRHFGKLPIVLKRIGITNEDELKNLINFSVIILWIIQPRTAGSLFGFPAISVSSTFLRALRNLMHGVEFWSVPGLRDTTHSGINSTATWMCHLLGPHPSHDKS